MLTPFLGPEARELARIAAPLQEVPESDTAPRALWVGRCRHHNGTPGVKVEWHIRDRKVIATVYLFRPPHFYVTRFEGKRERMTWDVGSAVAADRLRVALDWLVSGDPLL